MKYQCETTDGDTVFASVLVICLTIVFCFVFCARCNEMESSRNDLLQEEIKKIKEAKK